MVANTLINKYTFSLLVCFAAERSRRYSDRLISGWYSAFVYCYNALYEADQAAATEIWDTMSETLRADCRRANAHYEPYEGTVQDVAQQVNDAYLKAFDEEAGVQSYGKVADLLIAWYLKNAA